MSKAKKTYGRLETKLIFFIKQRYIMFNAFPGWAQCILFLILLSIKLNIPIEFILWEPTW